MQNKKILEEKEAEPKPSADEDGPASSEGAEEVRDITDDESATSSDERPQKTPHGAIYGGYFERRGAAGGWLVCIAFRRLVMFVASRRVRRVSSCAGASRHARGPHRQQREALCAIHALNNCLGGLFCTDEEMEAALEDYLVSSRREGHHEPRSEHYKPGGWYSSEVRRTHAGYNSPPRL